MKTEIVFVVHSVALLVTVDFLGWEGLLDLSSTLDAGTSILCKSLLDFLTPKTQAETVKGPPEEFALFLNNRAA